MTRYVVVGSSAGGIGAVEGIRTADPEGKLTLVSEEPYPPYSRPLISEYLAGEKSLGEILYRDEGFFKKRRIEARQGRRVESIDLVGTLQLDNGEELLWDRLILATGGRPIVPPLPGRELRGVHTFTTLEDARAISSGLSASKTAVVIGGGLIGISVAEALIKRGLEVYLIELRDRVLSLMLDETASRLVETRLRQVGLHVLTDQVVEAIVKHSRDAERVGGVVMRSGREIACDLVVVAIGVAPRADLANAAGIRVDRGILVDRQMATSARGVFACGDVSEAYDFVLDANRVVPIWPSAYIGGRTAGLNAAGRVETYRGGTSMNSLKYFGLSIASAGEVIGNGTRDGRLQAVSRVYDSGHYRKVLLRDGRLAGFVMVGDIRSAGLLLGLMRDAVPIAGHEEALMEMDLGLISLPTELRKARLAGLQSGPAKVTTGV